MTQPTFETILFDIKEGVGILTINRPKAMNSINATLLSETIVALGMMEKDPEVKAIIITGGEKVFAAGADIKSFVNMNAFEAREFIELVHRTMFALENNHKPVIAAICGFALGGGCEMALGSDIRVAADNATFGLPEISIGIYPGGGGTQRLPRVIGIGRAKELIFTGEFFDAKRAYEMGLVNQLVPADQVMETAMKLAKKLAKKPPLALRIAKSAINNSMNTDIKTGSLLEQEGFSMLFSSADQKEGMGAFLEGRKAVFQGK